MDLREEIAKRIYSTTYLKNWESRSDTAKEVYFECADQILELIWHSDDFIEAASEYCREAGWREL